MTMKSSALHKLAEVSILCINEIAVECCGKLSHMNMSLVFARFEIDIM